RLRFSGPKTSIICSPMTSLKTSIKTITYLSDIGCLEIQGASLVAKRWGVGATGSGRMGAKFCGHQSGAS
ncbi:hypothetical protein, partial [Escherichia coli]|uniref:hypothetical protein n=1 Tax=Escherichia coli TaxID=562 RepID=UPI002DD37021|nr:hypothetical protein [Escherichia coli]MEB5903846.1 hypothetical protein [Escherichia coli]